MADDKRKRSESSRSLAEEHRAQAQPKRESSRSRVPTRDRTRSPSRALSSPDRSSRSPSPVRFFEGRRNKEFKTFLDHVSRVQCDRCGKHGHKSSTCWYEGQCRKCGGRHRTHLCKSRSRSNSPRRSPSSSRSPGPRSPSRSSARALVAKSDTASEEEDPEQRAQFFEKTKKETRESKHE